MTSHAHRGDLPASRVLNHTGRVLVAGPCFRISTQVKCMFFNANINGAPMIFHDSNDTTGASWGLACFENSQSHGKVFWWPAQNFYIPIYVKRMIFQCEY